MEVSKKELEKKIDNALQRAFEYSQIDGAHHKAWVIDQMVRDLTGDSYADWVSIYEIGESGEKEYTWDAGIAP